MTSKKENILKESYPGLMTADDFWPLWDSLKDIWTAAGVAVKDLIGTSTFLAKMTFRIFLREQKIRDIIEENKVRKDRIWSEYEGIVDAGERRFPGTATDLHLFAFLADPGKYVAYRIATEGRTYWNEAKTILNSQGINVRTPARGSGRYDPDDPNASLTSALWDTLAGRDNPEFRKSRSSLLKRLNKVILNLEISESKSSIHSIRNLLREEKKDIKTADYSAALNTFQDELEKGIETTPEIQTTYKKAVEALKKEIEEAIQVLKSPQVFILEVAKAQSLEDILKATKILEKTPFDIDKSSLPKKEELKKEAESMVKNAKEKNQIDLILKSAGIKEGTKVDDEKLVSISEAVLTKQAIQNLVSSLKEKDSDLSKSIEEVRKIFLKNLFPSTEESLPLPEEIEEIFKKGREDISKAGKVSQESK